ncbi:hypothetical protein L9F63_011277, partial [Diploptera punctata]
ISDDEIKSHIDNHPQAVKRCVKLVTEASGHPCLTSPANQSSKTLFFYFIT